MRRWRIAFMTAGIVIGLFGVFNLVTKVPAGDLLVLAVWLVGAVLLHDGVLSPTVVGVGWFVARHVPARARGYLQGALIVGGLVTVIAIPMIYRRDSQPAAEAILQRNYGGNLTLVLALIAAASLLLYAARVVADRGTSPPDPDPAPAGGA